MKPPRAATWASALLATCALTRAAGLTDTVTPNPTAVIGDWVGAHDMRLPAHVIPPAGKLQFDLKVDPGRPLTIEIEEPHGRDKDVTGYLVYVDGVKRAFRTWEGCGAGPTHYFLESPAPAADHVHVTIENVGQSPVAIGRVWAFSDFADYFKSSGMDVPYRIAPTVDLKWDDPAADAARVRQISQSLGDRPNVKSAWTTFIAYAKWDEKRVEQRIDYVLSVAEQSGLPVQICLDSWWGDTPGGKWRDPKFQQVVWDDTDKRMIFSVPNRWANTP